MTDIIYVDRTKHADDGCDWTNVILWQMNSGARACSRSVFIPAPRPIQVVKPRGAALAKNKKTVSAPAAKNGRTIKTHTGTVIRARGELVVRLHETATVWSANGNENYDKKTGLRIGAPGRCRLLLETIKPIEKKTDRTTDAEVGYPEGELSAQALVALMKGKTLSYQAILNSIKKHHPGNTMTMVQLQNRIKSMSGSKYVGLTRHDDMPVTHFTLNSVDPRFYALSSKNLRA